MSVAFILDGSRYEIGSASFLNAFFSTVAVRLEESAWGTRFPVLMNALYLGALPADQAAKALAELEFVAAELAALPPSAVVWSSEDLSARPPWGDDIAPTITSMANYFVTSDGRDLLAVLREVLRRSRASGKPVAIG